MTSRAVTVRRVKHRQRSQMTGSRSVIRAMYAGLTMTAVATLAPYIDHATSNMLADHIRAGYPTYTQTSIDTAANTYLVYLSVIGAVGVAGWLWTIHAVKTSKRCARATATTLLALATSVALTDLLIRDTSGDTGLPHLLGWVGILPCLPGLVAVTLMWRRHPMTTKGDPS
jgi:hypothetical protein